MLKEKLGCFLPQADVPYFLAGQSGSCTHVNDGTGCTPWLSLIVEGIHAARLFCMHIVDPVRARFVVHTKHIYVLCFPKTQRFPGSTAFAVYCVVNSLSKCLRTCWEMSWGGSSQDWVVPAALRMKPACNLLPVHSQIAPKKRHFWDWA